MKKSLCRGFIAFTSLVALASCQDYDGGFSNDLIKKAEYAKQFEKTFGTPDPNQDWSMATLVKANVNIPGLSGTAKMNICTGDPRNAETRLLAQVMLKDGQGSIDFDAVKGMEQAYVTIEKDGTLLVSANFIIANGMLNLGDVSEMPVAKVLTRAAEPGELNGVTTAATKKTGLMATTGTKKYFWKGVYYTDTELRAWAKEQVEAGNMNTNNYAPFNSDVVAASGYDFSKAIINESKVIQFTKDGYYCSLNGQWNRPQSEYAVYTLDEIKADVEKRGQYSDKWPLAYNSVAWDDTNKRCDCSNATIDPAAMKAVNGGFYYTEYPNPVFANKEEMQQWTENNNKMNSGPFTNCYFSEHLDIDNATINTGNGGAPFQYEIVNVPVTYLNGVEKTAAPTWTVAEGSQVFGTNQFFMEQEYYFGTKTNFDKKTLYGSNDKEILATMQKIEAGFSIQTTGGEIDVPFVYGSTDNVNQFGYVYYKTPATEEAKQSALLDIFNKPHYILMDDGRPQSNIFWNTWKTGTAVKQMELSGIWNENSATDETKLCGTNYKLSFFGEDYKNAKGSYYFPAGYTVVFFICPVSEISTDPNYVCSNMNYSLPELNKQVQHLDIWTQNTLTYNAERGAVKAAAWTTSKGDVFMGFEDGGGDEDLNDIVFWVKGNFTPTEELIEVEVVNHDIKWHKNYDGKHDETDSDLHGSVQTLAHGTLYGVPETNPTRPEYTFLGWSESPNSTDLVDFTDPKVALADKCYYAVWQPNSSDEPTSITVKWHTNITTPGEHKTNDSDLFIPTQTYTVGNSYSQPVNIPTRDGYTFMGWSTEPTTTTDTNLPAINNVNVTNESTDICYFAVWYKIPVDSDPEWISWIFACEDLGGSFDYDFNDVVWEVRHDGTSGKVQARLLAAGGTLPFTLQYNGTEICTKAGVYGADNVSKVFISRGSDWYDVLTDTNWKISDNSDKFSVVVEVEDEESTYSSIITGPTTGAPNNEEASKNPEVILVPGNWEWPNEGVCIKDAYKDFTNWVFSAGMTGWADSKQSSMVISRQQSEIIQ